MSPASIKDVKLLSKMFYVLPRKSLIKVCFPLSLTDSASSTLQYILLSCSVGFHYFSHPQLRRNCAPLPSALSFDQWPCRSFAQANPFSELNTVAFPNASAPVSFSCAWMTASSAPM
jgi:hypothetical protein